eukprot:CAMPEP_0114989312 /NCGR_PEP_ID=MMETSP0216-20121206/10126_1 /TAXON_ID=223996 /ORGANISM="Protocruzia adherens, Strain Boccale" /LENGTH=392 /DNA_ID=CAMNT_0002352273 /DNA_START=71 /DNA_END=1246 /DNA_ORIENTATION=+
MEEPKDAAVSQIKTPFSDAEKNRIKTFLCILAFITEATFSIAAPFYPRIAHDHNMSDGLIGLVFGINQVTATLCSPLIGIFMKKLGRKTMISLGRGSQGLFLILFGLLQFVEDDHSFIVFSLVLRLSLGVGSGITMTSTYAILSSLYPETLEEAMGHFQAAAGLGIMLGPLIGYVFYNLGGFFLPFAILGFSLFILGLGMNKVLPDDHVYTNYDQNQEEPKTIPYRLMLGLPRVLFATLTVLIGFFAYGYLEPTLSTHIRDFYSGSDLLSVMAFIVPTLTFILGSFVVSKYIMKRLKKRKVLCWGLTVIAASFLILSEPFWIPSSIYTMFVGLSVMGFGIALTLIPCLPEMIESASAKYPEFREDIKDFMSGIYGSGSSIGSIMGPFCSGYW